MIPRGEMGQNTINPLKIHQIILQPVIESQNHIHPIKPHNLIPFPLPLFFPLQNNTTKKKKKREPRERKKTMKVSAAFHLNNPQLHLPKHSHKPIPLPKLPSRISSSTLNASKQTPSPSITTLPLPSLRQCIKTVRQDKKQEISELVHVPKWLILGSASLGLLLLFVGFEGHEAMALGPEGPIVEEFWDNMRRYGLYVLTVSTGAIYTILLPIVELLKNPISALILVGVLVGGFYLVSLVLGAMTGISDFSYDYSY